jgi:hypothetical protein
MSQSLLRVETSACLHFNVLAQVVFEFTHNLGSKTCRERLLPPIRNGFLKIEHIQLERCYVMLTQER